MNLTKFSKLAALAAVLSVGAGAANAAVCSVSDVTFSSTDSAGAQNADACSNALDISGNTPDLTALNNLWGVGFVEGVTLGSASAGSATGVDDVLGGFRFTLSGLTATTSGTYSLTIRDTNDTLAPNLPFYLDFVLFLKGGSAETAAYFFDDTRVDEEGGGAWTVSFLNTGSRVPALSNISLYVRNGTEVPEPGTIALLGLGLLGLAT
ncbi:MAG: hypothetical protein ACJARK_001820, partial [Marinobacter psychrophilus]|uniref:PEP-CTERM sorting domain-containing protein n=1 Tax=Marinobacter psychrophilus TaxID=330734 RepID=UPI0039E23D25